MTSGRGLRGLGGALGEAVRAVRVGGLRVFLRCGASTRFQLLESAPVFPCPFYGIPVFQYIKTYWNYWSPFPKTPEMVLLELLEFLESCGNDAMG
jgi:hypothetical protein